MLPKTTSVTIRGDLGQRVTARALQYTKRSGMRNKLHSPRRPEQLNRALALGARLCCRAPTRLVTQGSGEAVAFSQQWVTVAPTRWPSPVQTKPNRQRGRFIRHKLARRRAGLSVRHREVDDSRGRRAKDGPLVLWIYLHRAGPGSVHPPNGGPRCAAAPLQGLLGKALLNQ
jgi:hypothetical protein